ncbi:hypothetical protein AB4254_08660 [Vibrio breoganii]
MSEVSEVSEAAQNKGGEKTVKYVYWLMFANIFLPFLCFIVATIMAYASRGEQASEFENSHYNYVIKVFWRLVIYNTIAIFTMIGGSAAAAMISGWLSIIPVLAGCAMFVLYVWTIFKTVRGFSTFNRQANIEY